MAMVGKSDSAFSPGGGTVGHVTVKRNIADVKRDIKKINKCFIYIFIHEHLQNSPSTILFAGMATRVGELIGDNGWVRIPIGDGFQNFRKQISKLRLEKQLVEYIRGTPDIGFLIHEYPLDLYAHYPKEPVAPCILLHFPKVESNLEKYIELLSAITYVINSEQNVIPQIRNLFTTKKNIIDCSSQSVNLPRAELAEIYSVELYKQLEDTFKRFLEYAAHDGMPSKDELHSRADPISGDGGVTSTLDNMPKIENDSDKASRSRSARANPVNEAQKANCVTPDSAGERQAALESTPEPEDKKLQESSAPNKKPKSIVKRAFGIGGILTALAGLAELTGIDLLQIIQWIFGM